MRMAPCGWQLERQERHRTEMRRGGLCFYLPPWHTCALSGQRAVVSMGKDKEKKAGKSEPEVCRPRVDVQSVDMRSRLTPRGPAPTCRRSTQADLVIKPESVTPSLDASKWPLLLKNYDRLNVRVQPPHRVSLLAPTTRGSSELPHSRAGAVPGVWLELRLRLQASQPTHVRWA